MGLMAYFRLARAGYVLAREGAFSLIDGSLSPSSGRVALSALRLIERRSVRKTGRVQRLNQALSRLGPTYVKFGQTLATRPDIVGADIASDLSGLQDALPPFDMALVQPIIDAELGVHAAKLSNISEPIAAASIAQVHKADLTHADGHIERVAVKILRPDIEKRFQRDLDSFYAGARLAEALVPPLRRMRPTSIVETLDRSAKLELDLRFEASAISEYTENLTDDQKFTCPDVRWDQTAQKVLTTNWMDGIPLKNLDELDAAGLDRKNLSALLLQGFLKQAIGNGYFHADMHPGNLFANATTGGIVAVDFGIMGRISMRERRFLAEVLYGFITRDYKRMAQLHIDIGYVPATQNVDDFAAALRTVGEPMQGRSARDISMAKVLGQLLAITEMFDMHARPELILLQKNMVLVEGVSRMLDPDLDIWTVSKPFVSEWIKEQAGPKGQIEALLGHGETIVKTLGKMPDLIGRAESVMQAHETELAHHRKNRPARTIFVFGVIAAVGAIAGYGFGQF